MKTRKMFLASSARINESMKQMGFIAIPRLLIKMHFGNCEEERAMTDLYVYLQANAFFVGHDVRIGGSMVHVNRGEYCVQKNEVMDALKMGRTRFNNLVHLLQEMGWIEVLQRQGNTVFRIVDYDLFNFTPSAEREKRNSRKPAALDNKAAFEALRISMGGSCTCMYGPGERLMDTAVQEGGVL